MLSNRPIVIPDSGEVMLQVIGGRDASANFDMQSLPTILHGDRIYVRRSEHSVRFLHPRGWNYFANLRTRLGWNNSSYTPSHSNASRCATLSSCRRWTWIWPPALPP